MKDKATFQKVNLVYDVRYKDKYYQYTLTQSGNTLSHELLDPVGEPVEETLKEEIISWARDNTPKRPPKII